MHENVKKYVYREFDHSGSLRYIDVSLDKFDRTGSDNLFQIYNLLSVNETAQKLT